MKVHVGLTRELQDQLVASGAPAIQEFARRLGMVAVRPDRLAAFGILTGDAPAGRIPAMQAVAGVDFVEADSEQMLVGET
jgi:hypothetical protein